VPNLSRIAVIWEPTNPGVKLNFEQTRRDARKLGLTLLPFEVRRRDDFELAFAAINREPPDALIPITAPLTVTHDALIAEFALQYRLPTIAGWDGFARAGGLMYYGENYIDKIRRVAPYVDKILRGAKPSDLPIHCGIEEDHLTSQ
jgi:putative ABC transport system substrate-binding protein